MHQNHTRSQFVRRPTVAARNSIDDGNAAGVAAPEMELLRLLERAVEEQRAARDDEKRALPLVSRIETILGKHLEAANDPVPVEVPTQAPSVGEADETLQMEPEPQALSAAKMSPLSGRLRAFSALLLLCGLGAAGGTLVPTGPIEYIASGALSVQGSADTRAAMAGNVEKMLRSQRLIASTVSTLKLDHDPEFSGAATGALNVAADLLSVGGAAIDPVSRAEASLVAAIHSSSDLGAGTIDFSVTTGSIDKSLRIASYLASTATQSAQAAPAGGPDGNALKKGSDAARLEFDKFVEQSGEGNVKVATGLQQQIGDIDADLKAADQRIVATKENADRLRTAKVGDVLSGVLAPEVLSPALEEKRERYVAAKASLAQLTVSLGPRHPRLLAQQAETDGLRDAVAAELGKLLKQTNDDAKAAAAARRQLNDRRNALIAQSRDTGVDLARLTELRDKAAAARARLADALTTGSLPPDIGHVTLSRAPKVVTTSSGRSGWSTSLSGALGGLALGIALLVSRRLFGADTAPAKVEPSMSAPEAEPAEPAFQPSPIDEPSEVENLRAQIADIGDRLRSYAVASR